MLPAKDAAGAADDHPLTAAELSQAFAKAHEQREREEGAEREKEREKEEEKKSEEREKKSRLNGLDDRRAKEGKGTGGGRWKRFFRGCLCRG
jgi:hypothetical protein